MKLIEGEKGKTYLVEQMDLPMNIDRRLAALGMTGQARVSVLNKKKKGALIINVREPALPLKAYRGEHRGRGGYV